MRKASLLFVFFLVLSCASTSKNIVKKGELSLKGGQNQGRSWEKSLTFHRLSWFKGLTLMVDFLWYPIDTKSPFFSWFSPSSQQKVLSCPAGKAYVALTYVIDPRQISPFLLRNQLREQGMETFVVNGLRDFVKNHPLYDEQNLHLHEFSGFCPSASTSAPWKLDVPNFQTVELPESVPQE